MERPQFLQKRKSNKPESLTLYEKYPWNSIYLVYKKFRFQESEDHAAYNSQYGGKSACFNKIKY